MNKYFKKNNIPNILTIFRILFIPFILVFLSVNFTDAYLYKIIIFENTGWELTSYIYWNHLVAGILFLLASFTDFLDGYLSRKYNWISDFGKIWDPIADKLLINSLMILLSVLQIVPWYLTVIMVIRDLIVDGYRTFLSSKKVIIPANIFGKLKTVIQMIAIIIVLFIFNDINVNSGSYYLIQNLMFIVATICSLVSGIIYIVIANIKLKELNNNKTNI